MFLFSSSFPLSLSFFLSSCLRPVVVTVAVLGNRRGVVASVGDGVISPAECCGLVILT